MNWQVWDAIELILLDQKITPILAVVPDNRDKALQVSPPNPRFWDRVRHWQALGWTIGMHGWQHVFVTNDSGILGVNRYSEFAGLARSEQERKLRAGRGVFDREGIQSDVWVAPAHSFDGITIELLKEFGFRYISDGFHLFPRVDNSGMTWVPQQLWGFRWRPFGVWTVCLHINTWARADVATFKEHAKRYRAVISNFDEVVQEYGNRRGTALDEEAAHIYRTTIEFGSRVKTRAKRLSSLIQRRGFAGREKEARAKVSPSVRGAS